MSASDTFVIFELQHSAYAIPSGDVLHVEMLDHITPVPNTAPVVEGVVFSRGQLHPALNLRLRFGLGAAPPTSRSRLIYVRVHDRTVALIVDAAREFRRIPPDGIRPVEAALEGVRGNYIRGVATLGDRLVLLVDVVALLNFDDPAPILEAEAAATAPPA